MIAIFPELVSAADAGDMERLAVLARRYFGGANTFAPLLPMEQLLASAGLRVLPLTQDRIGGVGALLAKDERGAFTIVVALRADVTGPARPFLLAHLLGHFLLDVQPLIARGEWRVSGFREVACPLQRYGAGGPAFDQGGLSGAYLRREERADAFAAALLMPLGMLRRAHGKLGDSPRLADFFGVTRPCLLRRLEAIGLAVTTPESFLEAERSLLPKAAPAALANDPKPLATTASASATPRSFAAQTYGATERNTRLEPATAAPAEPRARSGMERLREIAQRLERTAPPRQDGEGGAT